MGWRKLRVYCEKEMENQILKQFGWPSHQATNKLVELYYKKTMNAVEKTLQSMRYHWLDPRDAGHAVILATLRHAQKWRPQIGPFSTIIEVWGMNALQAHIAHNRYPVKQGVGSVAKHILLEFESDDLLLSEATKPTECGLLSSALSRRKQLPPKADAVASLLLAGFATADLSAMLGVSRQRIAQICAEIRRVLVQMGAAD